MVRAARCLPSSRSSPAVGLISRAKSRASVDSPEPLSPTIAATSRGRDGQVYVAGCMHHAAARVQPGGAQHEVLGQAAGLEKCGPGRGLGRGLGCSHEALPAVGGATAGLAATGLATVGLATVGLATVGLATVGLAMAGAAAAPAMARSSGTASSGGVLVSGAPSCSQHETSRAALPARPSPGKPAAVTRARNAPSRTCTSGGRRSRPAAGAGQAASQRCRSSPRAGRAGRGTSSAARMSTGAGGARYIWPAAADSTSLPAYITAIVSAISISSDRSCVMNRTANPVGPAGP